MAKAKKRASKKESLALVCARINSKYKHPVMCMADELPDTTTLRRPSGIMELDIHTGGGFPGGAVTVVAGKDQSGKSELCAYCVEMVQRLYKKDTRVAIFATEGGLDVDRLRDVGVKIRLSPEEVARKNFARAAAGVPPLTKEEIGETVGEIYAGRAPSGDETLEEILSLIGENICQLIIVDSVTTLFPMANLGKSLTDSEKMAAHATMITRFSNRIGELMSAVRGNNATTVILTQQMRANQDKANAPTYMQKSLPNEKPAGAHAFKHIATVRLLLSEGSRIKKTIKGDKVVVGKTLKWYVDKGKKGTYNHRTGDAPFYYGGYGFRTGVDRIGSVIVSGIRRGVLAEKPDGVYLNTVNGSVLAADNLVELRSKIEQDLELELSIRYAIQASTGDYRVYREQDA